MRRIFKTRKHRYRLISMQEIEHWLIYHIPITDSWFYQFPFQLRYICMNCFFSAIEATPWDVYEQVAKEIFNTPDARAYVSKLYHYS